MALYGISEADAANTDIREQENYDIEYICQNYAHVDTYLLNVVFKYYVMEAGPLTL